MKLNFFGLIVLQAVIFLASKNAYATGGRDVGNGGGVWTCRPGESLQSQIRWIQFVDLFEGRSELGLNIPRSSELSFEALLDSVERKIFSVNREYYAEYAEQIQKVRQNLQIREGIQLEIIDDALYSSRPAPETCTGGTIRYEQLANYRDDGVILVDKRLWEELFVIDQAALYVHEAVYALLRAKENAQDSRKSRKVTAYLFSSAPSSDYAHLLNRAVLPPPLPQLPPNNGYPVNAQLPQEGTYASPDRNWCGLRVRHVPENASVILEPVINPLFGARCGDIGKSIELRPSRYDGSIWSGTWNYNVPRPNVHISIRSDAHFSFCNAHQNTTADQVCTRYYLN